MYLLNTLRASGLMLFHFTEDEPSEGVCLVLGTQFVRDSHFVPVPKSLHFSSSLLHQPWMAQKPLFPMHRRESRVGIVSTTFITTNIFHRKGNVAIKSELYKNAGRPVFLH